MSVTYPDLSYTSYPDSIQSFVEMIDMTSSDGLLVSQYQTAMQNNDFTTAANILQSIPNATNKILDSDKMNTAFDTLIALQRYFNQKYSPAYIVSESQPINQNPSDFWFQITGGA